MGIGPSTKETTLHHFRDPLLEIASSDDDLDVVGVVLVGTPQDNEYKNFVGKRTAAWLEAMRVDGAIISCDGWGNSHVDYANTIEEIGKRNIPLVGMAFIGTQAQFVVTNKYMDTIVDINKSEEGIETENVGENNASKIDAKKAVALLKLKMRRGRK
ncbi:MULTISPECIES: glycine/sarcosine/betaine reductase component B subunit [unclassified Sedimentibacter]|uniref:glycine/sarcosine/betaine reductase component B subunit n=1 Tax=unclassified Sedimentibacter TaxID=2649220 RepID=UPI001BD3BEAD|nr:glycine/sarcosine/betaine reductase component B subunit [Sedimentibacter sp. MB35-C1]WMJ78173.1 glycine/sarcosine/betaine reductase component B subunit [Sedimentibacter sp. MB35-C1]